MIMIDNEHSFASAYRVLIQREIPAGRKREKKKYFFSRFLNFISASDLYTVPRALIVGT